MGALCAYNTAHFPFSMFHVSVYQRHTIGAHSAGETPVLIPNTEAKPSSGDNTPTGEGSTAPNYKKPLVNARGFFFI